ncbi:ATP synthase subunit C lysine N-methyltransferase [Parasteatoda tepidariorum]|uniref:ATP synthase subunit C lysine N-methyltransferase n=1 Tax=Parasteatoda tepidariorum TaxID=114398 RepID=UPI00077FA70D|nr:ATP synthase subunit C lysine N-methyltransferase [Parasteatoda tepidariorum]
MSNNSKHKNVVGLIAVGTFGTVAVGLIAGCFPFVLPAFRRICLPYVPATDTQVSNVIRLLKKRKGKVIDLGSGDGRIVLSAAKLGFESVGVELNPWLVLYSKWKALSLGLRKKSSFKRQDIWKTDLRNFENVVIFGVEQMMSQLEEKLVTELSENACVIACRFPLPNWKESLSVGKGIDTVWIYEKRPNIYSSIN